MNKPKFRAWDKNDKKMRKVESISLLTNFIECELEPSDDPSKYYGAMCVPLAAGEYILMQYTGLKDKNGKQYCQDDLVRYEGKIYRLIKGTYAFELVGFYEASQDNPCDYFSEQAYYFGEIIGNIHKNPELLSEVE